MRIHANSCMLTRSVSHNHSVTLVQKPSACYSRIEIVQCNRLRQHVADDTHAGQLKRLHHHTVALLQLRTDLMPQLAHI